MGIQFFLLNLKINLWILLLGAKTAVDYLEKQRMKIYLFWWKRIQHGNNLVVQKLKNLAKSSSN